LYIRCLKHRILPGFFLFHIIVHAPDGGTAQHDDNRQVDECEESHYDIGSAPSYAELQQRTAEYDDCGSCAERSEEHTSELQSRSLHVALPIYCISAALNTGFFPAFFCFI